VNIVNIDNPFFTTFSICAYSLHYICSLFRYKLAILACYSAFPSIHLMLLLLFTLVAWVHLRMSSRSAWWSVLAWDPGF